MIAAPENSETMTTGLKRLVKRTAKTLARSLTHPPVTRRGLVRDLRALGLRWGGLVLVHSSLSALGSVVGGAPTMIRALLEVMGPEGTVVLPTHSWDEMEAGCRTFDVRRTRSCVGAITEAFRSWPGAVRSLHPTHSVAAIGPLADWLTAGHELCKTPCGPGTPYARILDHDGQILFLGADLNSNTAFHTIEAVVEVPYFLYDDPDRFTIIAGDESRREIVLYRHRAGVARRFREHEDLLVEQGIVRRGLVCRAKTLLLDGLRFRDFATDALRADPTFLLAQPGAGTR